MGSRLLGALDVSGCVVTLDALTAIAQQIVAVEAEYILSMKENQDSLYQDMSLLFDDFETEAYRDVIYDTAKLISEGHNCCEIRQCWVMVEQPEYRAYLRRGAEWSKLTSLIKLLTVRQITTKTEVTVRYLSAVGWRLPTSCSTQFENTGILRTTHIGCWTARFGKMTLAFAGIVPHGTWPFYAI